MSCPLCRSAESPMRLDEPPMLLDEPPTGSAVPPMGLVGAELPTHSGRTMAARASAPISLRPPHPDPCALVSGLTHGAFLGSSIVKFVSKCRG